MDPDQSDDGLMSEDQSDDGLISEEGSSEWESGSDEVAGGGAFAWVSGARCVGICTKAPEPLPPKVVVLPAANESRQCLLLPFALLPGTPLTCPPTQRIAQHAAAHLRAMHALAQRSAEFIRSVQPWCMMCPQGAAAQPSTLPAAQPPLSALCGL